MLEVNKLSLISRLSLQREDTGNDVDQVKGPKKSRKPILSRGLSSAVLWYKADATASTEVATPNVERPLIRSERMSVGQLNEPIRVKSNSIQHVAWTPAEIVRQTRSVSANLIVREDVKSEQNGPEDNETSIKKAFMVTPDAVRKISLQPVSDNEDDEDIFDDNASLRDFTPSRAYPANATLHVKEMLRAMDKSPFDRPVFGSLGPRELSFCLEDAYCPITEILKSLTIKYSANSDIVVCSPMRTGQTPIVKIIASLLRRDIIAFEDEEFLMDYVGFPGTRLPQLPVSEVVEGKRLFKTHMNLRCFVRAESPSANTPKSELLIQFDTRLTDECIIVIIPLRDPCRVLESWFRHLESIYESTEGRSFPFGQSDFRSFCPGSFNPAHHQEGEEYEKFLANVLSVADLPNVCIVFYEDLLTSPDLVVDTLAKFLEVSDEQIQAKVVGAFLYHYTRHGLRLEPVFSDEFLETRERIWCDHIQYRYGYLGMSKQRGIRNYYELYERLNDGRPYPMPKFLRSASAAKPKLSELMFFRSSINNNNNKATT